MMFREICQLIETRTGFAIGSTLQAGHRLQTAPDRCILVAETAGGATVPELPDRADFNIQVVTRSEPKKYFQAREDAWTVYVALHGTAGWNLPNVGVGPDYLAMVVDAIAIPQYIGQDEKGRCEFSVNFLFRISQDTCGI